MNKQSLAMAYSIKRMAKTKTMRARHEEAPAEELLATEEPAVEQVDDLVPVSADESPEKPSRAQLIASILRRLKA